MTPSEEAAAILIRMFNTLAYALGKRLRPEHRAELQRCCELLASGDELLPLDDLPPPPRREYSTVSFEVPPEVDRWKAQRGER